MAPKTQKSSCWCLTQEMKFSSSQALRRVSYQYIKYLKKGRMNSIGCKYTKQSFLKIFLNIFLHELGNLLDEVYFKPVKFILTPLEGATFTWNTLDDLKQ